MDHYSSVGNALTFDVVDDTSWNVAFTGIAINRAVAKLMCQVNLLHS